MARIRTADIDNDYVIADVNAALNLLISLTDDIAAIMKPMSGPARKALWTTNSLTITLGQKLRKLDDNFDDMEPRAD